MSIDPELHLSETLAGWGLPVSPSQLAQLATYAAELRRWNERVNLTTIVEPGAIYQRHFLDSLVLARHWGAPPARMADIGSGAGFPGLPLKILFPTIQLTLVESVGKKTAFLSHLVGHLDLTGVAIRTERAEQLGHLPAERESYDIVTARALAELRVLVEYALPLLKVGGRLLAPKGISIEPELEAAAGAVQLLGGGPPVVEPIDIPGLDPRSLLIVEKLRATPARYPRPPGVPSRRPL